MQDRSWMLNAEAIRAAKDCIHIIKAELGIKLLLSDPSFMQTLHEYVELTDANELNNAYVKLLTFAGVGKTIRQFKKRNFVTDHLSRTGYL